MNKELILVCNEDFVILNQLLKLKSFLLILRLKNIEIKNFNLKKNYCT